MSRIIYIHQAEFHKRPPVISAVLILVELGYEVTLATCGISDELERMLIHKGVKIELIKTNSLFKVYNYLKFRFSVQTIINKTFRKEKNTLIWIEGAQTIVSLNIWLRKYPFILQIQELHENSRIQMFIIARIIQYAKNVFMPEYNRTVIYQIWYGLSKRPTVLPNKPYFIPNNSEMSILKDRYKELIEVIKNKKVIIYQGGISRVRMLDNLAHAVKELGDDFLLVLLGKENEKDYIEKLKAINKDLYYIPFLPAPDYLVFTSLAYIGYVCYDPTSLNNAYCAPNKINEYSAFSLPMIGNDIPGLKYILEKTNAGIIADVHDSDAIKVAIRTIDTNYEHYKKNAPKIYKCSDNKKIIDNTLKNIISA